MAVELEVLCWGEGFGGVGVHVHPRHFFTQILLRVDIIGREGQFVYLSTELSLLSVRFIFRHIEQGYVEAPVLVRNDVVDKVEAAQAI